MARRKHEYRPVNPFTTKSDQCQISLASSTEILHHTVLRTWLFIAYFLNGRSLYSHHSANGHSRKRTASLTDTFLLVPRVPSYEIVDCTTNSHYRNIPNQGYRTAETRISTVYPPHPPPPPLLPLMFPTQWFWLCLAGGACYPGGPRGLSAPHLGLRVRG